MNSADVTHTSVYSHTVISLCTLEIVALLSTPNGVVYTLITYNDWQTTFGKYCCWIKEPLHIVTS